MWHKSKIYKNIKIKTWPLKFEIVEEKIENNHSRGMKIIL